MPEVVEVNRVEELQHYHLVWHALLKQMPAASFFHSLQFIEEHCRHVGDRQQLRVLVVYSGGVPVGILPLAVTRQRTSLGHVRVLAYLSDGFGGVMGPIGPNPAATLAASLRHLRHARRDWDLLNLCCVSDQQRTHEAMTKTGFSALQSPGEERGIVDTKQSWDEYLGGRPARFRENIERAESRVAELGEVTLERWRPESAKCGGGDLRWDLFDACAKLNGQLASETFLRRIHSVAAKAGAVDINLLRINGSIAAFAYHFHWQGNIFHVCAGADPRSSSHNLESVLFARMIRESCRGADYRISLRPRLVAIMQPWLSRTEPTYRHTHYPLLAPRVQLLRVQRWLLRQSNNQSPAAGFSAASFSFGELPVSTSM